MLLFDVLFALIPHPLMPYQFSLSYSYDFGPQNSVWICFAAPRHMDNLATLSHNPHSLISFSFARPL